MPEINRVLRADSEGHHLFRRLISAARAPLDGLAKSNEGFPLGFSAEVCSHSLKLLTLDTIYEFSFMLRPIGEKDRFKTFTNRLQVYNLINFPMFNSKKQLKPNEVLFLLVSNVFNRTDAIVEGSIKKNPNQDEHARGGLFLDNVLDHTPAVKYRNEKDETISVTPRELLTHIKTVAEALGFDTSQYDRRIRKIIQAQKENLDMLIKINNGERPLYSVDEAIKYRLETIGQYALLLSSFAFDDPRQRTYFSKILMDIQRIDDIEDILQDIDIQMNPYYALISEFDLLKSYKDIKEMLIAPRIAYEFFMMVFGGRKKDGVSLKDRASQIRYRYQKGVEE